MMNGLYTKLIRPKGRGFTLIEIMVASIIGAFVAAVAVGTLRAISVSAEMVDDNIGKAAEVRFASKRIAADLMNLYRDRNFANTRFVGTIEPGEQGGGSWLTFYTVSRVKARAAEPEGDVYEVEYYLAKTEDKSSLMRRLWPNPDKDSEGGGLLTAIAEDIDVFAVRYFDGQEWGAEWDEERRRMPELVEVVIAAKSPGKGRPAIIESFFVNFVRDRGGQMDTFETNGEKENATANNR